MTIEALSPFYLWIKSIHLMAVMAWMAGLFYLPRLYVYHSQIAPGGEESARFMKMERLLLKAIMNPAMIATWLLGVLLILTPGIVDWTSGWWLTKFVSVVAMTWFHGTLGKARRDFAEDRRVRTERHWRIMNEVPTVLMIIIVIMAIVKPF